LNPQVPFIFKDEFWAGSQKFACLQGLRIVKIYGFHALDPKSPRVYEPIANEATDVVEAFAISWIFAMC